MSRPVPTSAGNLPRETLLISCYCSVLSWCHVLYVALKGKITFNNKLCVFYCCFIQEVQKVQHFRLVNFITLEENDEK